MNFVNTNAHVEKVDPNGEKYKDYTINITYDDSHSIGAFAFISPFNNCQVYTIGCVDSILHDSRSDDKILSIFKAIQEKVNKTRLLIDVRDGYMDVLNRIFNGYFIFKTPYENASGNNMVMCMIDTTPIRMKKA